VNSQDWKNLAASINTNIQTAVKAHPEAVWILVAFVLGFIAGKFI
jgi:thiosulfate reductase cytochrome b subunit